MIDIGDTNRTTLEQSHAASYKVSAFYGADMTIADVPFDPAQSSITFTQSGQTQGTGSLVVPTLGNSLRPKHKKDALAAYGQELNIEYQLPNGLNIPLGRFRITDVPSTRDIMRVNPFILQGSLTKLTLADRLDIIQHDSFLSVSTPQNTSAWAEIRRISPIPVAQTLTDATVPASMTYQSKFDAITQLMGLMGGEPQMTRYGALTAVPSNSWSLGQSPATVVFGTVTRDDGMSNSLYNCVVATTSANANLVSVAQITDPSNPLCVYGPLGRRTTTVAVNVATTQAALDAAAQTYLTRYSTQQSRTVTITCLPRPDLELGDFIAVYDPMTGETVEGSVASMTFPLDPTKTMNLTLTSKDDA